MRRTSQRRAFRRVRHLRLRRVLNTPIAAWKTLWEAEKDVLPVQIVYLNQVLTLKSNPIPNSVRAT
jgi:hypothetical protein